MSKWQMTGFSALGKELQTEKDNGIILGASMIQTGEALGHGMFITQGFINDVVTLGNAKKNGVKMRFGHPNMCSEALGTFLGRAKNFRLDSTGTKALADIFLSKDAKDSPRGNLYDYILSMTSNNPDMLGVSIVFEHLPCDEKDITFTKLADGREMQNAVIKELFACDIVDDPASNRDGMFEKFDSGTFAEQVTTFLDSNPDIYEIIKKNPNVISEFQKRYEIYLSKNGENKMEKDKENEVAPTDAAAEVVNQDATSQPETSKPEKAAEVVEPVKDETKKEEEKAVVKPAESEPEKAAASNMAEDSKLSAFKALADAHSYEFAKENFGKSEVEISKILLKRKDAEIEALKKELSTKHVGGVAVSFNGDIKPKNNQLFQNGKAI